MRILWIVVVWMLLSTLSAEAQQADMRVGALVNEADWFALEEEYPALEGQVQTEFLKLPAESMIGSNFNRPDEAVEKIGRLMGVSG